MTSKSPQGAVQRWLIRGRVQGVSFRWFTRGQAELLGTSGGLRGTVRNLPDGRVEVVVHADARTLADFRGRLEQGPPAARVDGIDIEELPSIEPSTLPQPFEITR